MDGWNQDTINLIFASIFGCTVLLGLLLLWYLFKVGFKCAPESAKSAESIELELIEQEFKNKNMLIEPTKVIISDTLLGFGKFGAVYAGIVRFPQPNGLELFKSVAIKFCENTPEARMELLKEAKRQCHLCHPNVVAMLGVCMNTKASPMVLMERLDGDNMQRYLQAVKEKIREPLTLSNATKMIMEVADAGAYIHSQDHIHRDIAARNIMLTSTNPNEASAKLGDFGLSQHLYFQSYYQPKTRTFLPMAWIPPEVFKNNRFMKESDIWMFGVTIWEIFTCGEVPHENESVEKIMFKVSNSDPALRHLPTPAGVPDSMLQIMHSCWRLQPTDRPSFQSISKNLKAILCESQENFSASRYTKSIYEQPHQATKDKPTSSAVKISRTSISSVSALPEIPKLSTCNSCPNSDYYIVTPGSSKKIQMRELCTACRDHLNCQNDGPSSTLNETRTKSDVEAGVKVCSEKNMCFSNPGFQSDTPRTSGAFSADQNQIVLGQHLKVPNRTRHEGTQTTDEEVLSYIEHVSVSPKTEMRYDQLPSSLPKHMRNLAQVNSDTSSRGALPNVQVDKNDPWYDTLPQMKF